MMVEGPWLTEKTRNMLMAAVKSDIAAQLAQVSTDRGDGQVSMEIPKNYFIFDGAHTYNCPALFFIVDSAEIPDERIGDNHVNAVIKVYVTCVVEDREMDYLTIKCERYGAALFRILQRRTLVDDVENVKIYSRVVRFTFSPMFTKSRKPEGKSDFRKEIALELEVKHFENPTS